MDFSNCFTENYRRLSDARDKFWLGILICKIILCPIFVKSRAKKRFKMSFVKRLALEVKMFHQEFQAKKLSKTAENSVKTDLREFCNFAW